MKNFTEDDINTKLGDMLNDMGAAFAKMELGIFQVQMI